jgi:hypothetical protein
VAVLFGAGEGTDAARDTGLSDATDGLLRLEPGSRAGTSVGLLDIDGNGRHDLLVTAAGDAEAASQFAWVRSRRGAFDWDSLRIYPLPRGAARLGG